jgi:hypothetical protein
MEETENTFTPPEIHREELAITTEIRRYLYTAGSWAIFLSIISFIACGFLVIMGLFMGSMMNASMKMAGMPSFLFTLIYLVMALVYFFPGLYLLRFGNRMRSSIQDQSQEDLTQSFANLKSFFKYSGILIIVMITVYLLAMIAAVLVAMGR